MNFQECNNIKLKLIDNEIFFNGLYKNITLLNKPKHRKYLQNKYKGL